MVAIPSLARSSAVLAAAGSVSKTAPSLGFPQEVQQSWAMYSPYLYTENYVPPPSGCEVDQVNLLQRHGARYPTAANGLEIEATVKKLKLAKKFTDSTLSFVSDYKYKLVTDDLVQFGVAQSFDAGQEHYARYASLVNDKEIPFIRATSASRVVKSADNWTSGFAKASGQKYAPKLDVTISEKANDPLDDRECPAAVKSKSKAEEWANVFTPPIVERINSGTSGSPTKLNGSDMVNLMSLCAFDTVAYETPSKWCDLFTDDEWASYEYYGDIDDYYGNGYGQQLGRVQGVGCVNELLARLTGQAVKDETSTDRALDGSSTTFPLDRAFYADFTHDGLMISVFGAIGLFPQSQDLDTQKMDSGRSWKVSRMVPFSARMITERLSCSGGDHAQKQEYVRVLVNDAAQPLAFCGGDSDGMCLIAHFTESQKYAQNDGNGDWKKCQR